LQDYPDQSDDICDFLREKLSEDSDPREVKRAIDALIRRGHSYGLIRRCLGRLRFDTDDLPEG
jgi:SOS response regulatory protein OraA/RecX